MAESVTLTVDEALVALELAEFRHHQGKRNSRNPRWGQKRNLSDDVHGAMVEAGVALFCNDFSEWSRRQLADTWGPDTERYEIRGSKHPRGRLILHKDEKYPDMPVVFGTYDSGKGEEWDREVVICGWLASILDGQDDRFWGQPRGFRNEVFAIPQSDLLSPQSLLEYLEAA